MSSPSSPYKEVGLSASSVVARRHKIKTKCGCGDWTYRSRKFEQRGHIFFTRYGSKKTGAEYHSICCLRCGHPKFAVENKKCRGTKK